MCGWWETKINNTALQICQIGGVSSNAGLKLMGHFCTFRHFGTLLHLFKIFWSENIVQPRSILSGLDNNNNNKRIAAGI